MSDDPSQGRLVRCVYGLLIVVALSVVSGRIASVTSKEGDTPFLSANDRSRWCTIAALVENGTYQIDPFLERQGAKANRRPWGTIDLVRHKGSDGEQHYYSSKPPLLPTLYAGVYYVLRHAMGTTLSEQPIYMGRLLLWLINIPILAIFLLATIWTIDRVTTEPIVQCFVAACVCFGTMLLPFSISLNNHVPAAAAMAVALYLFVCGIQQPTKWPLWFFCGVCAAFGAANELPALSMTTALVCILMVTNWRAVPGYLLGMALVAAAYFGTSYIAHQDHLPPYFHRGNGELLTTLPDSPDDDALRDELTKLGLVGPGSSIERSWTRDPARERVTINKHDFIALVSVVDEAVEVRRWDDWYDYPGSYWVDGRRRGVDVGEPSRAIYATHMLIGHYGVFSLTPIWLFVPIGIVVGLSRSRAMKLPGGAPNGSHSRAVHVRQQLDSSVLHKASPEAFMLGGGATSYQLLSLAILATSAVCIAFYIARPEIDRNYGGVSTCFRWLLWLAPFWLYSVALASERLAKYTWSIVVGGVLLAASVFSMSTALSNPWQSPWLYRFWDLLGWLNG